MYYIFRRVRKISKSDDQIHVRLSIRMEQLDSQLTDFDEIWYLEFFRNSIEKTHVSLKSDKNNGYFTWKHFDIYDNISPNSY